MANSDVSVSESNRTLAPPPPQSSFASPSPSALSGAKDPDPDLDKVKQEVSEEFHPPPKFTDEDVLLFLKDRLDRLELSAIQVEQWILLQRRRFDLRIMEEPFHGLQVLFNPANGQLIKRIWGKTRGRLTLPSLADLGDAVDKHFERVVPCLGFFDFHEGFSADIDEMVAVEFPVPRVISKDCQLAYKLSDSEGGVEPTVPELLGIGLCGMCMRVKEGLSQSGEGAKSEPTWGPEAEEDAGETKDYKDRRKRKRYKKEEEEEEESDPDYYFGMEGNWSESSGDYDDEEEEDDYDQDGSEEENWETKEVR